MDSTFYVHAREKTILTTVTSNQDTVEDWIHDVYHHFRSKSAVVIGLDVEWKPSWRRGVQSPVATLQLCAGSRCLIVQLLHIDYLPRSVEEFLANPRHVVAGVGIRSDADKLEELYALLCENLYDVRDEVVRNWPERVASRWPGLKELARVVAGVELEKPRHVSVSDWGRESLSEEQVEYACLDAYASCMVERTLYFGLKWG